MLEEQKDFQKQVAALLEVAMFENWLRFYFIEEIQDSDVLKISLPDKALHRIKELYPGLYPMAESLNGKEVDFESSRQAVLRHILNEIEGKTMPQGAAQSILQSKTFQVRLQLFHIWEQMHEAQLDQGFAEFGAWKNLFAQWLETPGAQELAKKMMAEPGQE